MTWLAATLPVIGLRGIAARITSWSTASTASRDHSAVAATTGAAVDEAIPLTRYLKLPHFRRVMVEMIPTATAER